MPTEYIVPGPMWVKLRRTQCEQMSSELPLKADITQHSRHVSNVPLPDSCIAAIASYSITSSALTSSAGDVIRHRRRLFFPRVLVEHAQHGERHGLNPGLYGRLRHRREQGRVVARQLRTFALAGGSDALRLVDADSEEHRGHASVDELRIIFAGRDGRRWPELVAERRFQHLFCRGNHAGIIDHGLGALYPKPSNLNFNLVPHGC